MPHETQSTQIAIEPWHFAAALCDWITNRSATLEAPDVLCDAGCKHEARELLHNDSRNQRRHRQLHAAGLAALAATFIGCAQSELPVYPVSGHVAFEGDAAHGAQVVFHPLSDELNVRPSAEVDAMGNFRVSTYRTGDGAPAGEYIVTFTWHPYVIDGEDYKPGPNALPEFYASAGRSPLVIEILPQDNHLPPWLLSRCNEQATVGASTIDF